MKKAWSRSVGRLLLNSIRERPSGSRAELLGHVRGLLLCCRTPQRWREALRQLLGDYIMEQPMLDAINFLIGIITEARSLKLREPNGYHFVPVDTDSKPTVFPLDRWRHLMVSLGFMLEEPDTNQDIRLCSVFIHEMVPLPLLTGMLTLLRCMRVLSVHVIRWLLSMNEEDSQRLMSAVQEYEEGGSSHLAHWIQPLWDWHQPLLETLGYRRIVHQQHVHYVHTPGTGQSAHLPQVYAVLLAMYGTVSDVVQETSV